MQETAKVWDFNQRQTEFQVAIDGQISNWALANYAATQSQIAPDAPLCYIDTSTPIFRIHGQEQLDPELFLRAAPSFLTWILRWLFLEDVMNRYYDPRKVMVDLIANIYKEQRPNLIPDLIILANKQLATMGQQPISADEVQRYYRQDKLIWQLYAGMRRVDRRLHQWRKRPYPYILPGPVKR